MTLREYLAKYRIHSGDFAKKVGYSREHISAVCTGRRKASLRLAKAINEASQGFVSIKELMEGK